MVKVKVLSEPKYEITLQVTSREAEGIRELCYNIGGPIRSTRRVFDELSTALGELGVVADARQRGHGSFYFAGVPE